MDYTFWLGKEAPKVDYDVIPCPPDYIMVEVPKPDPSQYSWGVRTLEMSPLYTGVDIPK